MSFLSLTNIQKEFGSTIAVENFNLEVQKGEFVTFLGPSGCGKTTTLRMIAGFETQTSGTIRLDGEEVSNKPANQRKMGMVFQSYALFPNLTIADNIGFGLMVAHTPKADIDARVDEMLKIIHLPTFGKRYPYQLSGGQQQRVALARALAIRPQVLLLDEPLSALDAKIRVELRAEIRSIQQTLGITTIYVTHDQEEAMSLSDRVVVMKDGHIEQIGTPFEIYNFPATAFTASFIGTLNVITGKIHETKNKAIELDGQIITTRTDLAKHQNGDQVLVALRPEGLSIDKGVEQGLNQLKGTIDSVNFLGSVVRVKIQVGSNQILVDTFNHPHLQVPAAGTPTVVHFPPEACLVLEQN
jgi:putative spermidine/putrescine transport system ATP-binding protein